MKIIINFFEDHLVYLLALIAIIVGVFTVFVPFESFRNLTSDVITIISITLAIDGLFLGILINLKEDSPFFKRAHEFNLEENIFKRLVKTIIYNIYLNIFFIIVTLGYDVIPAIKIDLLKKFGNIIWASFFIFLLIGTVYIVSLINKINDFNPEQNNTKFET